MAKHPYLPLYTGDWLKDPKLSSCTPAARGVWIDLLCGMHELDRSGKLCGTAEQLARIARCSTVDLVLALTVLQTTGAADVSERNGTYEVCNRRMRSDYERRKCRTAMQKQRRQNARGHPCNTEEAPIYESDIENAFLRFWEAFPKGRKMSKGKAREAFEKALDKTDADTIIAAATSYAESEVGRGQYVKMPATWLNQECWADDAESWRGKSEAPANGYAKIGANEFRVLFSQGKFREKPTRHPQQPSWVFGTLKDGRRVECLDYPLPEVTQ